jgi:hypothetical protein
MGGLREGGVRERLLDLDGLAAVDEPVDVGGHRWLRVPFLELALELVDC